MKNKKIYFPLLLTLLLSCFAGFFSACKPIESQPPEPVLHTVTFISDGEVYSTSTTYGSSVSLPAEPAKNEMVFKGWFLDKDIWSIPFDKQSVSSSPVTSDISVYALWENMTEGLEFELMPHEESFVGRLYKADSVPDMYKELNEDENAQAYCVSNYTGTDTDVQIPAMYNGKFVTVIQRYAFGVNPYSGDGTNLTSAWIPDSIIRIDYSAFQGNTHLTSVRLSQNIISIGINSTDLAGTFQGCTNLKSVILPDSLEFIGASAFDKTGLTSIKIPDNVASIWFWAFNYCTELTNVRIGSGVKVIDTSAFNHCISLTTVTIDSETIAESMSLKTSNGSLLFYADTIYIKSDITLIGDYITSNFTKSTDIVIMDGISYYVYTINK